MKQYIYSENIISDKNTIYISKLITQYYNLYPNPNNNYTQYEI